METDPIAALRAAQATGEPVARVGLDRYGQTMADLMNHDLPNGTPLYTLPPATLTLQQARACVPEALAKGYHPQYASGWLNCITETLAAGSD